MAHQTPQGQLQVFGIQPRRGGVVFGGDRRGDKSGGDGDGASERQGRGAQGGEGWVGFDFLGARIAMGGFLKKCSLGGGERDC